MSKAPSVWRLRSMASATQIEQFLADLDRAIGCQEVQPAELAGGAEVAQLPFELLHQVEGLDCGLGVVGVLAGIEEQLELGTPSPPGRRRSGTTHRTPGPVLARARPRGSADKDPAPSAAGLARRKSRRVVFPVMAHFPRCLRCLFTSHGSGSKETNSARPASANSRPKT